MTVRELIRMINRSRVNLDATVYFRELYDEEAWAGQHEVTGMEYEVTLS